MKKDKDDWQSMRKVIGHAMYLIGAWFGNPEPHITVRVFYLCEFDTQPRRGRLSGNQF